MNTLRLKPNDISDKQTIQFFIASQMKICLNFFIILNTKKSTLFFEQKKTNFQMGTRNFGKLFAKLTRISGVRTISNVSKIHKAINRETLDSMVCSKRRLEIVNSEKKYRQNKEFLSLSCYVADPVEV